MKKPFRKKKKQKSSWDSDCDFVSYVCSECNTEEDIPPDVVDLLDVLDPGDPSVSPRFVCEKCGGAMWPA